MRLLILTFSYAPQPNPRAIRWTALAEEFVRRGYEVAVVTGWQPGKSDTEICNGVRIFRVGSRIAERLRGALAARRSGNAQTPDHGTPPSKFRNTLVCTLDTLNRFVWSSLWWPDSTCVWYGPAIRKARELLSAAPVDAVISVSPTFTAVLAGYRIAGKLPGGNRWIVDLGDPFSFMTQAPPNNFRLYGTLNRWFERRVFSKAAAISVTNQATRELYAGLYPESALKIAVIPPLLTTQQPPPASLEISPFYTHRMTLKLVYLGTLYGGIRRPDFLLQLFQMASIPSAELHFFGDIHECRDIIAKYTALNNSVVVHGSVSWEHAMQAIKYADVLVNLGNDTTFQLPSKLVEYTASGKPILSISRATTDSSAQFLAAYPRTLCLHDAGRPPSADQLRQFTAFCTRRERNEIPPSTLERFLRNYRMGRIADQYEVLLGT